MRDISYEMQRAAEEHLRACQEAFCAEEDGIGHELPESPACGPFCGCDTCLIRETLHAAWPIIESHFLGSSSELVVLLRAAIRAVGASHPLAPRFAVALARLQQQPGLKECEEFTSSATAPSPAVAVSSEPTARRHLVAVPGPGGVVLPFRRRPR